jgi:hypothetical protein
MRTSTLAATLLLVSACANKPPCECFEFAPEDRDLTEHCPKPSTCERLVATCPDDQRGCALENPEAVDCLLAAVAGDEPAKVEWEVSFPGSETQFAHFYTIRAYNFGDGQVVWTQKRSVGIAVLGEIALHDLADLPLAGCSGLANASARFDCLQEAFETPPAEVCREEEVI